MEENIIRRHRVRSYGTPDPPPPKRVGIPAPEPMNDIILSPPPPPEVSTQR